MIKIGVSKDTDSALLAYPGFGQLEAKTGWRVHVSGLVWQVPVVFSMRQRMMIRMLGGVMQASSDQMSGEVFQSRIVPFMAEADHRRSIIVTIGKTSHRLRKKTRRNGRFSEWVHISEADAQLATEGTGSRQLLRYSVALDDSQVEPVESVIYLYPQNGLSVVSDIDDTIKDSSVGDRRELLANTFLREFRSVDGMANVYQKWSELGAEFHYVSSSPWQLFRSLLDLQTEHAFPAGTLHLRNFRLRDQLLKKVAIRRQGKATAIKSLLKNLPQRDFVLVGDSGEKDPKIYHKICRKFPQRVKGVFIRQLEHRPLEAEKLKKIQNAVEGGVCGGFSTADELMELSSRVFPGD